MAAEEQEIHEISARLVKVRCGTVTMNLDLFTGGIVEIDIDGKLIPCREIRLAWNSRTKRTRLRIEPAMVKSATG